MAAPSPDRNEPLTHAERRKIVFGVLLLLFLGSLDQTNLASALPTIGADIGHVQALPWLITIYLLAGTAITPLYGKISDIHGRRVTLRAALMLYVAGSLVCALAPNFYVLLGGRALQGLGGGGLTALAMVVLGDVAAPKDRGRYYAYFSIVFTTSGAAGPVLGGFLAQYVHWSAIFWLNIPAGLVAIAVMAVLLRRLPRHEKPHRLDILGAVLIVVASVAFMLLLNLGGKTYAWLSAPVLGLAAVAAVGGLSFVARLKTAPEPLIPLSILANPVVRYAVGANALGWGAIFVLNIFLPIFLQSVTGLSASTAGLSLMILMVTVNIGAGVSGQVMGRVTHYKRLPVAGLIVAILATTTLAWQSEALTPLQFQVLIGLIGVGFGPLAPVSTVSLQNAVLPHQFGIAIGAMNFTRSLCTTMLIAACGALVLSGTALDPAALAPGGGGATAAQAHLVSGFRWVFVAATASMVLSFVCLLMLEEKPLETDAARAP
jgi:EmrB/QacA subfamily drug resistance transporter